jgi:Zinc carboxypeptidase/Carboxypeptidase regulatory-like domain/Secretion system C-terminal sorting domain
MMTQARDTQYAKRPMPNARIWRKAYSVVLLAFLASSAFAVDPRYHTYGEMTDEMVNAALQYPNLCRLYTIGYSSFFHLPILAMKISDNPDLTEDEPKFLFNGVHHACELIGVEICLYMMNDLLTRYDTSQTIKGWVDSNEIWLVPMINPDGHHINITGRDSMWRKNLEDNNHSGQFEPEFDGVDLNRNYDFMWQNGDPDPTDREYRGSAPFSEMETQAIRDLALDKKFVFDICFHGDKDPTFGESVYYPWIWGSRFSPDYPAIRPVAESIAYRIINDQGNAPYVPIWGEATDGGLARNWFYHKLGIFSFTLEVSQRYQPPGYRVDSICRKVTNGSYYLFERILGPSITGHVTDAATNQPVEAEVRVLEAYASPDTIAPRYSDAEFGRYRRILKAGYYTIQFLAAGYDTVQVDSVPASANGPTVLDVQLHRLGISESPRQDAEIQAGNFLVYPNFVKGKAKIRWQVLARGRVSFEIYDNLGKKVSTVFDKICDPGTYTMNWDGKGNQVDKLSSGIYFLQLKSNSQKLIKKIILSN